VCSMKPEVTLFCLTHDKLISGFTQVLCKGEAEIWGFLDLREKIFSLSKICGDVHTPTSLVIFLHLTRGHVKHSLDKLLWHW
jgi:hypothetical protein